MPSIARPGFTGRLSSIGTTPLQLSSAGANIVEMEGVQLLASSGNAGTIYVGFGSGITTDAADTTDGFPLAPGTSVFIPTRRVSDIWVIATISSQKLWFLGQ